MRLLLLNKKKIVITQHGVISEELKFKLGLKYRAKFFIKYIIERFLYPSFLNYIFISNYSKSLFPSSLKNKLHKVIPNALNSLFLDLNNLNLNFLNSILYTGVICKRKNLLFLLEVLNSLKDEGYNFKLNIAGGFREAEPEYKIQIQNFIKNMNLSNSVIFHGWVSQKELYNLIEKNNIFILPSIQENSPVSITEALGMGKVVIASNIGGISEMFEDQKSGFLFTLNSYNELQNILRNLFNNLPLMNKISVNGIKIANDLYHPNKIANETILFYNKVLKTYI